MDQQLQQRLITAGILSAIVLLVLGLASVYPALAWLVLAAAFFVSGIAAWEFAAICTSNKSAAWLRQAYYFLCCAAPALFVLFLYSSVNYCDPSVHREFGLIIPFGGSILGMFAALLYAIQVGRDGLEHCERVLAELLPGVILIGLGGSCLTSLSVLPDGRSGLIWLIAVVAVNDSAAYFGGKALGGPKLAPLISPNKTVSGTLCGFAGGLLIGLLLMPIADLNTPLEVLILASICIAFAQSGDLLKSFVKRRYNVKDSGSILPGHGGVLDRIDGHLMASIVMYLYLYLRLFQV